MITVADCDAAKKQLMTGNFELVIVDSFHDDGSEIDACAEIAKLNPNMKIVLNSEYPEYKRDFRSWVADVFLVKSPDLSELKATIRRLLNLKSP